MKTSFILRVRLDIILQNVTFVSDGGIFGSIFSSGIDYDKMCTFLAFLPVKLRRVFLFYSEFLEHIGRVKDIKIHNIVPLEVNIVNDKADIRPIIPGSIIKGLLRYAYDVYNAVEIYSCNDIENLLLKILRHVLLPNRETLTTLISDIKNIFEKFLETEENFDAFSELFLTDIEGKIPYNTEDILYLLLLSYILSLQSYNSCLSIFDRISCSLPLSKDTIRIRKLLSKTLSRRYEFTICKSCLVFGCKGYKSPIIFTKAEPHNDTRIILRTFNQICQQDKGLMAKTAPYTLTGFDKNLIFESQVLIRYDDLYSFANKISTRDYRTKYIDLVIEVLEKAIKVLTDSPLDCIVRLGRRGSVGYGKVYINVRY